MPEPLPEPDPHAVCRATIDQLQANIEYLLRVQRDQLARSDTLLDNNERLRSELVGTTERMAEGSETMARATSEIQRLHRQNQQYRAMLEAVAPAALAMVDAEPEPDE